MAGEDIFVASIFSSSDFLDPAAIQTAGQYIVLHQIIRPLVQLDREGQIVGNLAESWRIRDDYKEFHFKLKQVRWSDGSLITSSDVKNSYERQIRLKTSNHFNFNILKEVKVINKREFVIYLNARNTSFIRQISYPEFGILSESDCKQKTGKLDLKKVSGAYIFDKYENGAFYLRKNKYFEEHTKTSPEYVKFEWTSKDEKLSKIKSGKVDFAVPFSVLTKKEVETIDKNIDFKFFYPHIGYTFWLSINPASKVFKDIGTRRLIQNIINADTIDVSRHPFWEPSHQLYLPDGLGRPSKNEIGKIWKTIKEEKVEIFKKRKISILIDEDFPFISNVINLLKKNNFEIDLDTCKSSGDFFEKIKKKSYDLFQVRNDFSSIDLHENLQTTFNPKHSLIVTDEKDNQFQDYLRKALNTDDDDKRHEIYKDIARKLLTKGYITPIAYHKVVFIHKNNVDISAWSKLFPEISIWKIKIK